MRLAIAVASLALAAPAAAQTVFRCTGADGKVSYQETPCDAKSAQKRVPMGPAPDVQDEIDARRNLERDAWRGSELSGRLAGDARERERDRYLKEMRERDEAARRAREEALKTRPEDIPWNPPWGFPGRPGQALPKPKPSPSS
ncbi:MAG: DUF4124 domain-containing protein [Betaproteobacteria bacterium]|nr:DUF4124 domain-containing protein [Betaproteobacteria bacterium]